MIIQLNCSYQNYDESRIDRTRGNNNRNTQAEKVNAFSVNWDAQKELRKVNCFTELNMYITK